MWIFCAFIITSVVGSAFTVKSNDITVACVSCKKGGSSLEGVVGGNLTIRYTINKAEFALFVISINSSATKKIVVANGGNVKKVGISERYIVPSVVEKGDSRTLEFTLTKLSLPADNRLHFKYEYTDSEANQFTDIDRVTVNAGPTFCKPPAKDITVEVANKFHTKFSLCGNPKPSNVAAKFGDNELTVVDDGQSLYQYDYKLEGDLKKEWCGEKLVVTADGYKTASFTSNVKLLFTPDPPSDVKADRDGDTLKVSWSALVYGNCETTYHVRYTKGNSTIEHRSKGDLNWKQAGSTGNVSVAVNAEVNGISGLYGKPVFIYARSSVAPTDRTKKEEGDSLALEYIVAIVVVVTLIVVIAMGVCILRKRKGKMSENARYDVDMQPLAQRATEPENNYADVNSLTQNKSQEPQMIYAELGPTGGRTGQRPVVEQSNYAQVKTEGVHYPNLQQSSYTSAPVSRNRQPSNDYDDNSFDYESSVVV